MPDTKLMGIGAKLGREQAERLKRAKEVRDQIIEQRFMRQPRPMTREELMAARQRDADRLARENAHLQQLEEFEKRAAVRERQASEVQMRVRLQEIFRNHKGRDYVDVVNKIGEAWGEAYAKYLNSSKDLDAQRAYLAETSELISEAQDLILGEYGITDYDLMEMDPADIPPLIGQHMELIIPSAALNAWRTFALKTADDEQSFREGLVERVTTRMRLDLDRQRERFSRAGVDPEYVLGLWKALRPDIKLKLIEDSGILEKTSTGIRRALLTDVNTNGFIDALLWAFPPTQRPPWIRRIDLDWNPAQIATLQKHLLGKVGNEALAAMDTRFPFMLMEFAARALESKEFGIGGASKWDITVHLGGDLDPLLAAYASLAWTALFPGWEVAFAEFRILRAELEAAKTDLDLEGAVLDEFSGGPHSASLWDLFLVGEFSRGSLLNRLAQRGGAATGERELKRIFDAPKEVQMARIKYLQKHYGKWMQKPGAVGQARKKLMDDLDQLVREAQDKASEQLQKIIARAQERSLRVAAEAKARAQKAVQQFKDRELLEAGQRIKAASHRNPANWAMAADEEPALVVVAVNKYNPQIGFWVAEAFHHKDYVSVQELLRNMLPAIDEFALKVTLKIPPVPPGSKAAKLISGYSKLNDAGILNMSEAEMQEAIGVVHMFDPSLAAELEASHGRFLEGMAAHYAVDGSFQRTFLRIMRLIDRINQLAR